MSDPQKLKDRLSKLQVQINPLVSSDSTNTVIETEFAALELPLSLQPELHQQLRESNNGRLNWKKALRSQLEKHTISSSRGELSPLLLEGTIQQIAKKRIIVSVSMTQSEDAEIIDKLTKFLNSRGNLFKDLFDTANVCLIRVHKGLPVIEVSSYEAGTIEFVSQRLKLEAARSGSSLNSFQIENQDGWLSIAISLSEKPFRSFEEISK